MGYSQAAPCQGRSLFDMLNHRLPALQGALADAMGYIVHIGARGTLTANWKTTTPGNIPYSAGTLDVHMRDTYHNAFHVSKRASRTSSIYSHLVKEDRMECFGR